MDFLDTLKSILTPEVIASIVSCITAIGALLKVVSTLKIERKSNDEIATSCKKASKEVSEEISKQFAKKQQEDLVYIKQCLVTFAKAFMLMQQQDSNSKIAILKLIEDLGACDIQEIKLIENNIIKQDQEQKKKEEERKNELEVIEYEGRC